ncbi:MAG: glycosyltransferase family 2 protein [Candidatus Kuenenbacteria bacterium]
MISVIIPVYNTPAELMKCLASLAKQIYREFEVIIVDDGSVPQFPISNFQFPNLDIEFFRIKHGGAPKARNFGFEKSKGEYVLFCDADLELKEDCLEKMLKALRDNPDKSYAYSDFKYGWKKFKFWPFDAEKLKEHNYINICSLLRRENFSGFDESLPKFQDWDLWLTLLEQGKTGAYIPEVLFKASTKRGSMSKWLPKIVYKLPLLKLREKGKYEKWKKIVLNKHNLLHSAGSDL